jgi:hypothetical protein
VWRRDADASGVKGTATPKLRMRSPGVTDKKIEFQKAKMAKYPAAEEVDGES